MSHRRLAARHLDDVRFDPHPPPDAGVNAAPQPEPELPATVLVRGSPSGRISGSFHRTPLAVGIGVLVTTYCGDVPPWSRMRGEDLHAQQHREVLVGGVVAMVDIGAAELAEADLQLDLAAGPQPPDVLAHEPLRGRDRVAAAVDGDAFLEMQVDRDGPSRRRRS